jgi:hypothetical protein
MVTIRVAKQIIDFNKIVFNDNFSTRKALYEQTERLMSKFWGKSPILSEEGRKFTTEWMKTYKTGCENFQNAVNENFEKVEDFFNELN